MAGLTSNLVHELEHIQPYRLYGRVAGILGLLIEVAGLDRALSIGGRCELVARGGRRVLAEVWPVRIG